MRATPSNTVNQDVPLLTTKFYIAPVRPELVSRPRLTERLKAGLHRKLTLVCAPAGFGKTTLLSEWASRRERPLAWISLDEADNDPDRFLSYLVSAVQLIESGSGIGETVLAARQSPQPLPLESILTTLINEIAASLDPAILVLDDYHVITAQPVHDMLAFLLNHLPHNLHLIISSRAVPPLPLARLRARDQLNEIQVDDLRFTLDEVSTFLDDVMRLKLAPEDVAALENRTEGWIAGVQLAALSLQGRDDPGEFIASLTGADRYILDYLTEEVLYRQPESIQSFLLRTSILERMTGPLCEVVTGRGDAQIVLERLEADNLFIVPLDNERRWYRHHQLFRDFLRDRLAALEPETVTSLHRRAAEWCATEGLIIEAVGHALAAQEFDHAAALIQSAARGLFVRGEISTILQWIDRLPEELVRARPRLSLLHAWALFVGARLELWHLVPERVQDAALRLGVGRGGVLEALAQSKADSEERIALCELAIIQAFLAREGGDLESVVHLFQAAHAYVPAHDLFLRMLSIAGLGSTLMRQGEARQTEQIFGEAKEISRELSSDYGVVISAAMQALTQAWQGQLNRALDTYRQTIDFLGDRPGRLVPFSGQIFVGLANILRERNDLQGALRYGSEGISLGEKVGDHDALREGHVTLARVRHALGDREGQREALRAAETQARRMNIPGCIHDVAAWGARMALTSGDVEAATQWAARRGLTGSGEPTAEDPLSEPEILTYARVLIAQNKAHEALATLKEPLTKAERDGRSYSVIEILALQALSYQALGQRDAAVRALARALLLGEPEGFVRIFVDEGAVMAALLRTAGAQGHSPGYVQRLLTAFGATAPSAALQEPLSERELEVLGLMAEGLTNAEIAAELVIAVSTVKTHINRIYGKLDVRNRTQAVARARDLHLLS